MFAIPSFVYLVILYGLLFFVPLSLSIEASGSSKTFSWLVVEAISISIFSLTYYRTKSEGLTLHYGLLEICESKESGCANITIVYIIPLLITAYLLAVLSTFAGLLSGRRFTQERWIAVVAKLGHGSQYGPIVSAISEEVERSPRDTELLLRRAKEHLKCGKIELAIADFDRVLSLDYRNADVLFQKARACEDLEKITEAIATYKLFLQHAPKDDGERRSLVKEWLSNLEKQQG